MNPSTRIHWLINENAKALLRYNPNISVVLCPGDYEKTIKDIKFDVVYSFDEDIDLELLSSLQYINIVGLSSDNNQLEYCERSKNWFDMSLVSKHGKNKADEFKKINTSSYGKIFSKILNLSYENINPKIFTPSNYTKLRSNNFFYLGITPFAGQRWPSKSLGIKELAKLVGSLEEYFKKHNYNFKIVFFNDGTYNKEFNYIKKRYSKVIVKDTKNNLHSFIKEISRLNYLITADTFALHIAVAFKVRNLSFFTSSSADEIDTYNTGEKIKSNSKDYCSYNAKKFDNPITSEILIKKFIIDYERHL